MNICVALGNRSFEQCVEVLGREELCELRLDLLDVDARLGELFASPAKVVVTYRPVARTSDASRRAVLERACALGAAYVDIEIEAGESHRAAIVAAARRSGTKVILSYHNFSATPDREALLAIVADCFDKGADVAKVACAVKRREDNAVLLSLLAAERRPMVVAGMGPLGKIVRISAPLLGALFTFAAPDSGAGTADGQLSASELRSWYEKLK